jgi:hypothetical protein
MIRESRQVVGPQVFNASFVERGMRVTVGGTLAIDKQAVMRIAAGIEAVSEREFRVRTAAPTPAAPSSSPMRLVVPARVPDGYRLERVTDDVLVLITEDKRSSVTLQAMTGTRYSIGGGYSDERSSVVNGRLVVLYTWRLPNPPEGVAIQPATYAETYTDQVYVQTLGHNVPDDFIARIAAEAIPVDEAGFHEFLRRNGLE